MGIDPGKKGGISIINNSGEIIDYSIMPETEMEIFEWINGKKEITRCFIEKVHSMPNQSSKSTFTFGKGYGGLRMALIASNIPFEEVLPKTWQKEIGITGNKGEARPQFKIRLKEKAQNMFPMLKLWEETKGNQMAVCDSLLIAEYARRNFE